MRIANRQDASDLDLGLYGSLPAPPGYRPRQLRQLYVEKLDFNPATGWVGVANHAQGLEVPEEGERVAARAGVNVRISWRGFSAAC